MKNDSHLISLLLTIIIIIDINNIHYIFIYEFYYYSMFYNDSN